MANAFIEIYSMEKGMLLNQKIAALLSTTFLLGAVALTSIPVYAGDIPGTRLDCRNAKGNKVAANKNCNDAPLITTSALPNATEGQAYSATLGYTDTHNDPVTWRIVEGPEGMTISAQGVIQWQPGSDSAPGYTVTVLVADDMLGSQASFALTVEQADNENHAPVITSEANGHAQENTAWSYALIATDADGDNLTYSLESTLNPALEPATLPEGLVLSGNTLSWTPSYAQAGDYHITIIVSDGTVEVEQSFIIEVANTNRAPQFISTPVTLGSENTPYTYIVEAIDPDNQPLSFSLTAFPLGMTLIGNTISWLPGYDQSQAHTVTVEVTDGETPVPQTYMLNISNTNRAPVVTSTPVTQIAEGQEYSYTIEATDADGQALTYLLNEGPTGMTLVGQTLSWQPGYNDAGSPTVIVAIDDGEEPTSHTFTIAVANTNLPPQIISPAPTAEVMAGETFTYAVQATDADGDSLTYEVLNAPAGMSVQGNTVTWIPMNAQAGPINFTVSVRDAAAAATQPVRFNVKPYDSDGDGYRDDIEQACGSDIFNAASLPLDTDFDLLCDPVDNDDDGDGFIDTEETACASDPLNFMSVPLDTDVDGQCNVLDSDDDHDGVADSEDTFPLDATESADNDNDGTGNNADTDDDNDGTPDTADAFPLDANESIDTDMDGTGNNTDTDDDNDGVTDSSDQFPLNATESVDSDSDGTGNNADTDDDNDGTPDAADAFPLDAAETVDTDGDGIGDNADSDIDGDGVPNLSDAWPLDGTRSSLPVVLIDTPATLTTVGSSPVAVTGHVEFPDQVQSLTLNGQTISLAGNQFSGQVALEEGHNTVIARMVTQDGIVSTASVSISLDKTPPYITVESHTNGQVVYDSTVQITGLINDIVRGTVEATQAVVQVNGQPAQIVNRSYAASVVLQPGVNTITVQALDQAGNVSTLDLQLVYQPLAGQRLNILSGNQQTAAIGNVLAEPLVVQVLNNNGQPAANQEVIFRVSQGSGTVAANSSTEAPGIVLSTDSEGKASTLFRVGLRSGVANHKVTAKVVGYTNEVVFTENATAGSPDKVSVNSGNNQRGAVFTPLPSPFVVNVTDNGPNVVAGAKIRFSVTEGGGLFQNGESSIIVSTDSDGRAAALMTLGGLTGLDQQHVYATLLDSNNEPTLIYAGFTASGFHPGDAGNTSVSGFVQDNQDAPLPGVTVRIDGTTRQAVTNDQGAFTITEAPVGPVHLLFDGSTTTVDGEYPTLSSNIVTVAGVDNPLSAPMYMVKLNTANAAQVGTNAATISLPEVPGFKLEIAANSVTFPDGAHEGQVSVTVVNSSALPMSPPNGMQPQFIVTIQPAGTQFYPPARLTLPNTDGRAPGDQVEMFSYDHDLEEFVAIGLGTVSKDGSLITSNPGVGVVKAGWHCGTPPAGAGSGGSQSCAAESDPFSLACYTEESGGGDLKCDNSTPDTSGNTSCSVMVGDPINLTNGNHYEEEVDYVGPGVFPITLARYYNSRYGGWTHSYSYGLFETERPKVTPIMSSGTSGSASGAISLKKEQVKYYQLRFPNGKSFLYENSLGSILDPDAESTWKSYADVYGDLTVVSGKAWRFEYRNSKRPETLYLDALGRVVRIARKDGFEQTITYSQGQMLVTDALGNQATLKLTESGALREATVNGLTFNYENNKATYPDGRFKQYFYQKGYLAAIIDEKGITSSRWTYDRFGRATSSQRADGTELTLLHYEAIELNPRPEKLTLVSSHNHGSGGAVFMASSIRDTVPEIGSVVTSNEYGKRTTYHFEKVAGQRRIVQVQESATQNTEATTKKKIYYDNGNVYQATDWQGNITEYAWDDAGHISQVTRAKGTPQQRISSFAYNGNDQLTSKTVADVTTSYTYNTQQLLHTKTIGSRTWTYNYNPLGLLTSIDGPRTDVNDITTLEYDTPGRVSRVINALNHTTQLQDYNAWNLPQTLIDANGTRTELLYDLRGRLTRSTVKSRAGDAVTQFTLDDEGLITAITLPNGVQLFNGYDNADRLIELRDADGNKINYTYDARGNRTEVKRSDGAGQLLQQQQWLYDDLGRVMQAIGGAGQTTSVSYNVNSLPTNTQDGNNNEWQQGYDALERLVTAYDPTLQQVQYGYDKRDNLTQVTDQRGLHTTYTYNDLDQVTSISSPDTGTQTLHYDNAGNLSDSTDAKGQRVDYTYDALNRLKTVAYANAVNLNVTYTYDQYTLDANAAPEVFNAGIGRLTQISDASGTTQYRYDDKGNLHTRLNTRAEGITLNTTYQYDAASNLTGLGYPGGITVNYQRNHLAQVTGITLNHNGEEITLASNIAYQGMGPVTNITWGNGLSQLYSYDQSGRVSGYALSSGNKNITFAYDGNNNITQQIDIANQLNNYGYNYDELNRLVEEDGYQHSALPGSQTPYNKSFTYDGVSNRLSKTSGDTTQAYHYSDTSNRLQGVDAENYQFDANGNTLVRASQSWQYNAQNRMASYSEGGVQLASYGYNGQGERVTKQVNGETIHYLYNAAGQLQGEYHYSNGNLTLRQSYVWLGMLPVAMLKEDLTGQTEQLVYIHSDHLNSPRMITDQNQNTVWQWHSSAFGEELPQENGLVFNLRFPGQYFDVESGINYNYYRDYDPASGSYLQSDPIGLKGGLNTYGYVGGNPVGFVDYRGLLGTKAAAEAAMASMVAINASGSNSAACFLNPSSISCIAQESLAQRCVDGLSDFLDMTPTLAILAAIIYEAVDGAADAPVGNSENDLDEWIYGPEKDPKINDDGSTNGGTWSTPDDYGSQAEAEDKLDPFKPLTGKRPVKIPAGTPVQKGKTPGGEGPFNGAGGANETYTPGGLPPGSVGPWQPL